MGARREPTNRELHKAIERLSAQVEELAELVRGGAGTAPDQPNTELVLKVGYGLASLEAKTTPRAIISWIQGLFRSQRFGVISSRDLTKCYHDGYLHEDGIKHLVNQMFTKLESKETFISCFKLYEGRTQLNWLAATPEYIVYILDDGRKTKSCNDNIEWILPKSRRSPVVVDEDEGTVSIGPLTDWLYSEAWHQDPSELSVKIQHL